MKQIQKAKGRRGSADERQAPLAVDPRDPDIVHAHRIARRSRHPGAAWQPRPRRGGAGAAAGHG